MRFDLVIAGGRICDGTGAKPFRADLGIKGRMIEAVGDLAEAETPERFDASGMTVMPGFTEEARTMSRLSPVARMERPRRVPRKK